MQDEKCALENDRNSPSNAAIDIGEAKINPVHQHGTKSEDSELYRDHYIELVLRSSSAETLPQDNIRNPRIPRGEYSDWNTGAVELIIPIPIPAMIRPTISCAREYDDA